MNIKIGDTLVSRSGSSSIARGKVIALGEESVVVRVEVAGPSNGHKAGDLYQIIEPWWDSSFPLYKIEDSSFALGKKYRYTATGGYETTTYKVTQIIDLNNPARWSGKSVAVTIATDSSGIQWVESFGQNERKNLVEV